MLISTWLVGQLAFAAFVLSICLLVAAGLTFDTKNIRWQILAATLVILAMAGVIQYNLNRPAVAYDPSLEQWITANVPPKSEIGLMALDVHNLAVPRSIIDLSGKLDQNVDAEFRHGDFESALLSSLPEYLLVPSTPLPVMQAPWFLAAYSELTSSGRFGGNTLFHRNIERSTFGQTYTMHQGFPEGRLYLTDFAFDRESILLGRPFRVQLDWQTEIIIAAFQIQMSLFLPPHRFSAAKR